MEQSLFEILKDGMGDYSLHHLVWHLLIVSVCIFVTGIFSIADTISGVYTAKKTGEKLRSHRLLDILPRLKSWAFPLIFCKNNAFRALASVVRS